MCNIKINHIVTSNWYGFLSFGTFVLQTELPQVSSPLPIRWGYKWGKNDAEPLKCSCALLEEHCGSLPVEQHRPQEMALWRSALSCSMKETKFLSSEKADELRLLWQNIILTWLGLWQYMPEPVEISLICVLERFSNTFQKSVASDPQQRWGHWNRSEPSRR